MGWSNASQTRGRVLYYLRDFFYNRGKLIHVQSLLLLKENAQQTRSSYSKFLKFLALFYFHNLLLHDTHFKRYGLMTDGRTNRQRSFDNREQLDLFLCTVP